MIKVYTGNGKGKTTSALAEALIGVSCKKKVMMVQFLKGSTYSGELMTLHRLGVPVLQFGVGCRWSGMIRMGLRHCNNCGECFRENRRPEIGTPLVQQGLNYLKQVVTSQEFNLIILDEVSHVLNKGFLDLGELVKIIVSKDKLIDWVLTGRTMSEELMPYVDEWIELDEIKHPFRLGVKSRRGIEY